MSYQRSLFSKLCATTLAFAALSSSARSFAADVDTDGTQDEVDAVPCDARASSVAYAPAQNVQGSLVFEDNWPQDGDLDFNDVVLNYN